jgi:hypothetical protein
MPPMAAAAACGCCVAVRCWQPHQLASLGAAAALLLALLQHLSPAEPQAPCLSCLQRCSPGGQGWRLQLSAEGSCAPALPQLPGHSLLAPHHHTAAPPPQAHPAWLASHQHEALLREARAAPPAVRARCLQRLRLTARKHAQAAWQRLCGTGWPWQLPPAVVGARGMVQPYAQPSAAAAAAPSPPQLLGQGSLHCHAKVHRRCSLAQRQH